MKGKMRLAMAQMKRAKKMPLGEGSRFRAMEAIGKAKGMKNPAGFAASVGRKKYGAAKFQRLGIAARKRKSE